MVIDKNKAIAAYKQSIKQAKNKQIVIVNSRPVIVITEDK